MKRNVLYILIAAVLTLVVGNDAHARKKKMRIPAKPRKLIAVIKSRYDDVEKVLQLFHIPHDVLTYRDLEIPEHVLRYRSLFVPSGIDNPMEESLDVYANNFRFKSVALKPDFYEVDKDKVAGTLRRFVRKGGSAYFSGYSYEFLQQAFDMLKYFDNFPFMGMPARIEVDVSGDLSLFSMKKRMALYMDHPGWVAIQSVRNAEVVAKGAFETPRGVRTGPITFLARRGGGELLYTSYDSTVFSDFRRFNIYRIAGAHLLERLEDEASRWGQTVTGRIVNAIHDGENAEMHRIVLKKGRNTIYFYSEKEFYQIDLVDRRLSLLESRDLLQREQSFTIQSPVDDYCYIRLYPYGSERFGMYTVISAAGMRIIPYLYQVLVFLGTVAAGGIIYVLYRLFFARGYSGHSRL